MRERKALTLEDAIRKMSSAPASRARLKDRGRLAKDVAADIVVFDPSTVMDRATFEQPFQYPVGIQVVIVNGKVALREGMRVGTATESLRSAFDKSNCLAAKERSRAQVLCRGKLSKMLWNHLLLVVTA